MKSSCSVQNCKNVAEGRGLCKMHYQSWYRQKHPEYAIKTNVQSNLHWLVSQELKRLRKKAHVAAVLVQQLSEEFDVLEELLKSKKQVKKHGEREVQVQSVWEFGVSQGGDDDEVSEVERIV